MGNRTALDWGRCSVAALPLVRTLQSVRASWRLGFGDRCFCWVRPTVGHIEAAAKRSSIIWSWPATKIYVEMHISCHLFPNKVSYQLPLRVLTCSDCEPVRGDSSWPMPPGSLSPAECFANPTKVKFRSSQCPCPHGQ